jgi:hypothetical protein
MATLLASLSIERVVSLPTEASLFLKVAYWYPYFSICFCHCTVSTSYKERCRAKLKQGKQINSIILRFSYSEIRNTVIALDESL